MKTLGLGLILLCVMGTEAEAQDPPPAAAAEVEELMQADRAFDRATAQRGADGWVASFAENGAMLLGTGEVVVGRAAIGPLMTPVFDTAGSSLRWEPKDARVLIPGELGYTTGNFERIRPNPDGTRSAVTGTYMSVWKKIDGEWKVVFDTGGGESEPRAID